MTTILDTIAAEALPTAGQLFSLFTGLAATPASFQTLLIQILLDDDARHKLAVWAGAFASKLTEFQGQPPEKLRDLDVTMDTDFLSVMSHTTYVGNRMEMGQLERASAAITQSIEAANIQQGIMIGIALGQAVIA